MKRKQNLVAICIFLVVIFLSPISISAQTKPNNGKGVGVQNVSKLPSENKRWALVIGVDNYRDDISPLYGSVNDAKALKNVLVKNAGFPEKQVILMTTDSNDRDLIPNRGNILFALDKLSRQVPEDGLILFSFSGHGVSVGKDAFLIPSDGRIYSNPELLRDGSVDVLRVKKAIEATKATQVLMLLDACRNDPLKGKGDTPNNLTEAYSRGFSFDKKNEGIKAFATIYATSYGDRAFEFKDKNTNQYRGFFSYAIEEGLKGKAANKKGEITLGGLIDYIEKTVKQRVYVEKNRRQVPYPILEGFGSQLVLAIGGKNSKTTSEIAWYDFRGTASKLLRYDYVFNYSDGLAKVKINGKYGFIDEKGDEIIPVKYDFAYSFSEKLAVIGVNNGSEEIKSYGFIDQKGKVVIPIKYDYAFSFSEGVAKVFQNQKEGFINKNGKSIFSIIYDYDSTEYENILYLQTYYKNNEEKVSFIPFYTREEEVEELSSKLHGFKNQLTWLKKSGKKALVNNSEKVLTPFKYIEISRFSKGLAVVSIERSNSTKYGFINKQGKEVIPPIYEYTESFSEGLALAEINGKYGFIDVKGNEIIPIKYELAESFNEGSAMVKLDGRYGFINSKGREIIPIKYESAKSFSEGLAMVELDGRYGFVNNKGREVIPIKYEDAYSFRRAMAKVKLNGKTFYIDKTDSVVLSEQYSFPGHFDDGIDLIGLNYKKGLIDPMGKVIVSIKFDGFWCLPFQKDGFIGVELNGKKGFVDIYGNEYFDF